jgi:hypothetical protein
MPHPCAIVLRQATASGRVLVGHGVRTAADRNPTELIDLELFSGRVRMSERAETRVVFLVISSSYRWKAYPCDRQKAEGEHEPMHYSRPALARS